jgi:peptide/nickel transport system substrate-binding protein
MKNKVIISVLSGLIVSAVLLSSCGNSTSATTTTQTAQQTTTTTTTTTATTKVTTTPPTGVTTGPSTTGKWWDKLGVPQYGGTLTIRINSNLANFDPYMQGGMSLCSAWMERMTCDDWTLDPAVFSYNITWRPSDYVKGQLAESWEFTDPSTYVIHLRKGIRWQDIPPANGREFLSSDIIYHFERNYGIDGIYKASPYLSAIPYQSLDTMTAPDKYTVIFKWKVANPEFIAETLQSGGGEFLLENKEAVTLWGDLGDWHHAIGTGPFILKDVVSGSSATLSRNPNYYGFDERYPKNQLPYVDTLNVLIIPDDATTMAAVRTGKIDAMDGASLVQAQQIQKSNPEIVQYAIPFTSGMTVDPRSDVAPFTDLKVRKAMQMAIDLPTIAKTIYGGTVDPYPLSLTSKWEIGWGFPYDKWPQDLKDEYAYNPTQAKALLSQAGYPTGFKTNVVADASGDMDLLQIVKSYFLAVGIDMEIRPMDAASWNTFVRTQKKYDQMSYRSTGSLASGTEPIRQLNGFQTGSSSNYRGISDAAYDKFYPQALDATSIDACKAVVKNANEYAARQHWIISLLQPTTYGFGQPWLKGFTDQAKAITGTGTGPSYLAFYCGRYWIDSKLKKSMGH